MSKSFSKETKLITITMAAWGIVLIGSGFVMDKMTKPTKVIKNDVEIIQKRIAQAKTNEIKLKEMELEINQPLSMNVKDYLEDPENLDNSVIKQLKLDTSMVNPQEAGTYTYTISYQKKKYNGNFTIKEKELPKVELEVYDLIKMAVGTPLSTDLSTYIKGSLEQEVINNIVLDISNVYTNKVGRYDFFVTYNGKMYQGKVEVYEPQLKIITPGTSEEEKNTEEKSEEKQEEKPEEKQEEKPTEETKEDEKQNP